MSKVRTRYAPSPTGKMHVGNLRSALYEFLIAKHAGGDFMLRIEDKQQIIWQNRRVVVRIVSGMIFCTNKFTIYYTWILCYSNSFFSAQNTAKLLLFCMRYIF